VKTAKTSASTATRDLVDRKLLVKSRELKNTKMYLI